MKTITVTPDSRTMREDRVGDYVIPIDNISYVYEYDGEAIVVLNDKKTIRTSHLLTTVLKKIEDAST